MWHATISKYLNVTLKNTFKLQMWQAKTLRPGNEASEHIEKSKCGSPTHIHLPMWPTNKIKSINVIRENNYVPECSTPTHLQLNMWPAKTFTSRNVARETLTCTKWPKKTLRLLMFPVKTCMS